MKRDQRIEKFPEGKIPVPMQYLEEIKCNLPEFMLQR